MKRLNKKGFTLVELLAVIVILAIVVGITLVTVLPTLKNSRQKAFELTAQTAADYFEKQYQLYMIGEDIPTQTKEAIEKSVDQQIIVNSMFNSQTIVNPAAIKQAGLKPENYTQAYMTINSDTGRACVYLYASINKDLYNLAGKKGVGEYYDATAKSTSIDVYNDASLTTYRGSGGMYAEAKSSACS